MATVKLFPSANSISSGSTWTNPQNIYADDGVYAVTPGARNANWDIIGQSFGANIPAGATINSVTIEAQYRLSTTASASTLSMFAQYIGTQRGTSWDSTAEPTVDTIVTHVNTGTWTAEELNSGFEILFRVRRTSNTACDYLIDYLAVTIDYTEPSYNFSGSGSIVMSSSVSANGSKQTSQVASIELTSAVSADGQKNAIGSSEVSMTATVTASGTAQEEILDRVGSGSITETFSLSANGSKIASGSSDVAMTCDVQSSGSKNAHGDASIGLDDTVSAIGSKHVSVIASIVEGFTVYAFGFSDIPNYDRVGYGEITMSALVESSGTKSSTGEGVITHFINVLTNGYKNAIGSGDIILTFEIVSAYTKVEFTDETTVRVFLLTVKLEPVYRFTKPMNKPYRKRVVRDD